MAGQTADSTPCNCILWHVTCIPPTGCSCRLADLHCSMDLGSLHCRNLCLNAFLKTFARCRRLEIWREKTIYFQTLHLVPKSHSWQKRGKTTISSVLYSRPSTLPNFIFPPCDSFKEWPWYLCFPSGIGKVHLPQYVFRTTVSALHDGDLFVPVSPCLSQYQVSAFVHQQNVNVSLRDSGSVWELSDQNPRVVKSQSWPDRCIGLQVNLGAPGSAGDKTGSADDQPESTGDYPGSTSNRCREVWDTHHLLWEHCWCAWKS